MYFCINIKTMKKSAIDWLFELSKERELDAFDLEKAKEMEKEDRFNSIMHFLRECVPAKLIEYYSKTPLN